MMFLTVMTAILCMILAAQSWALSVESVRVGEHSNKVRLVIDLNQYTDFRVFTLGAPERLVIDMPRFSWNVKSIGKTPQSLIQNVRQGALTNDISRIAIDMGAPVVIQSAFLLPRSGHLPDRLVIDYAKSSAAQRSAQNNKIFGTLREGGAAFSGTAPDATPMSPAAQNETLALPPRKPETQTSQEAIAAPLQKPLIVIDAGHGGQDPGAISPIGSYEKTITLAMARELKAQLESTGRYRVKLTRDRDIFLRLHQRVNIAREHDADLFISLHADSINRSNVRGASVYTLSETASDKQTARLAERENKADIIAGADLSHQDMEVANILIDLAMRDTMNQSKFFANTIVSALQDGNITLLERPHRYAGFAVLKAPDIPSVLIEIGFMSNRTEALKLTKDSYRAQIAHSIMKGIDRYFATVAENSRI